jgi:galactofuranose transport system substrate-binding protein
MKRIVAIIMVLVMALGVSGCGKKDDGKITIGFSQLGAESDWRVASTASIKSAVEGAGYELIFSDAQQKQENQIKALRSFITQKVDVIAFSPVVESGWDEVLEEIKDAGIPLILVDRATDNPDDSLYVTFMGSNFVEEGEKAGQWLVDYLTEKGRINDPINVVELQGTVGSAPANDRKTGFETKIKDYANIQITKSQTGDFTRALGKEVMESFLKSGDTIDVLYAHNDDMALGAIQAIKDAGLKPGQDIIIIGVDAVKGAFEAMAAGEMNVSVECNPLLGPQLVDAVDKLMKGEALPKWIPTIEGVYPQEVAAKELPNRQY